MFNQSRLRQGLASLLGVALSWCGGFAAADWPMWRFDAQRSAVSSASLPAPLHPQWSRSLGEPRPAWPEEQDYHGKLDYDRSYEPIVLGQRIIVPSMASDRVTALDTRSGVEAWRFYADGPVRFAPVGWRDRVFFVSDDGHLYCLQASDGALLWKMRGGPADRALLGNQRLISSWPARGAPVVADDEETVYFAAGIWPFMGTFIHAVDANTGRPRWTNSGTGAIYNLHQHGGADAFGGVAPQGYLAVQDDQLVVAGGLTVPAVYDRHNGDFLHFEQSHAAVGKGAGGFDVATVGQWYINNDKMYALADGTQLLSLTSPLLGSEEILGLHRGELVGFAAEVEVTESVETDRRGRETTKRSHSLRDLRRAKPPVALERLHLQAGETIVATTEEGDVATLQWPNGEGNGEPESLWQGSVSGTVWRIVAADDRLFVVTEEGSLHCFGPDETTPREFPFPSPAHEETETVAAAAVETEAENPSASAAAALLEATGQKAGFAIVWGVESGELVEQLVRQSDLQVIAVDEDAERIGALRRRLDDAGLYGYRAHAICADPNRFPFPPYFANLIVSERSEPLGTLASEDEAAARLQRIVHPLRPYGGIAHLELASDERDRILEMMREGSGNEELWDGATAEADGSAVLLTRAGALPGAGEWTHQYGSSAQTVFSTDQRVKAPLGVLWFGGPSNHHALPRHAQGPIPHVVAGRLIIEGVNSVSSRCVYTGRVMWIREFPDIGFPYKANNHTFSGTVYINNQPGANFVGSNYVSTPDSIYVVYENECHRLSHDDGSTLATFQLPPAPESDDPDGWGYIGTWGDYLVAGAGPRIFDDERIGESNWNATSSERVVVMDRFSGEVLWSIQGRYGFRHNAIVPVDDKLFLMDRLSEGALKFLARRGLPSGDDPQLMALDLASGDLLWSTSENIFGTWLSYSAEHDILLQAGRTGGRAPLPDEPSDRIIAHRASTGEVVWDKPLRYTGPLIIHGDQIISSKSGDGSFHLLTGEPQVRRHPLTGSELPWTHSRTYGCGTVLACANLLTFRSGAAGFFDIGQDGGTGNFGGFRAGCTPNLIPADGVLNAPDYTRTCSCSYQNQTSLALIHQPDVEIWTYSTLPAPKPEEVVQRVGINFGAAGDRLLSGGSLWLDYPSVGGKSPDLPVDVDASQVRWFREHSSLYDVSATEEAGGDDAAPLPWVASSGLEGAGAVEVTLHGADEAEEKRYTVRLHFSEPQPQRAAGERRFDVLLQNEPVLEAFDVVQEAGGPQRALVREFTGVGVNDRLRIELRSHEESAAPPVLSGIEAVLESP